MQLVERYVREVERRLPRRLRSDVGKELRSLLEDSVEERVAAGRAEDQAELEVLSELGPPNEVALRYADPPRGLIGPELVPAFWRTFGVLVLILALLSLTLGLLGAVRHGDVAALALALPNALTQLFSTSLQVLGLLVLVFGAVEALSLGGRRRRAWDPSRLTVEEESDRVGRLSLAVDVALLGFLLVWCHVFPEKVGILLSIDDRPATVLPVLGDKFWRLLPWLSAWWIAALLLKGVLLGRGRWSVGTRLAEAAVQVYGVAVLAALATGGALLTLSRDAVIAAGVTPEAAEHLVTRLLPVMDLASRAAIGVAAVLLAVGVLRRLVALVMGKPRPA